MINQHVAVEHVLQSGLKMGDEIRVEQNFLLENIAVPKVLSGHALDYCDHLADILASRLLVPCWRRPNSHCFGDRRDCARNQARDRPRSVGVGLRQELRVSA